MKFIKLSPNVFSREEIVMISKYSIVTLTTCVALLTASCNSILKPGQELSKETIDRLAFCSGEARSAYGIGLEVDYEGTALAKAKAEADTTYESGGISSLLSLETLTEKNRESLIASHDKCKNGDLNALTAMNEELKKELEAKKKS